MAAPAGTGWAQLRQQARSLETQTETLFHTYSQLATTVPVSPSPTPDEQKTESQLTDLLERRSTLISRLALLLDSSSDLTASALKQSNLARHRETLASHRQTLAQIRASIAAARDRANLLSTVRSDIDAYRSANPEAAEADYMLDERRRIDNSHNIADGVLSQAYAVNESFGVQRETLASINRRIVGAASQVPGINGLMGRIGAKKRRDGVILGSFIALCFLVVFFFS
ncbi:hypothetical protein MMC13_004639 [Lambiella insularis]|nr:hypothetical protein [Lambiella insularis]